MSELQSLSLSDALQMIKRRAGEIDNTRVFICLKRMRFKPVRVKTVEDLKMLIALDEYHLPVTSHLWDSLTDSKGGNSSSSLGILHTLGDKKVLTLKRSELHEVGSRHSWILSDTFKQYYYGAESK